MHACMFYVYKVYRDYEQGREGLKRGVRTDALDGAPAPFEPGRTVR